MSQLPFIKNVKIMKAMWTNSSEMPISVHRAHISNDFSQKFSNDDEFSYLPTSKAKHWYN